MKSLSDFKPYEVIYVDAMNLAYRSYHGIRGLSYHGRNTGMMYGIVRFIMEWQKKAPRVAITFLWEGRDSWRKKAYPIYKAHRGEARSPDETKAFFEEIDRIRAFLPSMNVGQAFCPTYEADDVAATLVPAETRKTLMSSGDWDWWELSEYADVFYQHNIILTPEHMVKLFEKQYKAPMVPVNKLVLFKLLCGDSSDKVSGVPRFPRKLASKVCNSILDINQDNIVWGLIEMGEHAWAEKVKANDWILKRNKELLNASQVPLHEIEWVRPDYNINVFGDALIKSGMEYLYDRLVGGA